MIKRNILGALIFMFSLVMVSCKESSREFTFNNLHVDFLNVISLGIGPKNSSNTEIAENQLVSIDVNGTVEPVMFCDEDANVINIPYNLYMFDVSGGYTYLIYYRNLTDKEKLDYEINSQGIISIDVSYIFNQFSSSDYDIRSVIIHNQSGTVFDYSEYAHKIINEDKWVNSFSYSPNGIFFHYITSIEDGVISSLCTNTLRYYPDINDFMVDANCLVDSPIISPFFGFESDRYLYYYRKDIYLLNDDYIAHTEFSIDEIFGQIIIDETNLGLLHRDGEIKVIDTNLEIQQVIKLFEGKNDISIMLLDKMNRSYTYIENFNLSRSLSMIFLDRKELILYDFSKDKQNYKYFDFSNLNNTPTSLYYTVLIGNYVFLIHARGVHYINLENFELNFLKKDIDLIQPDYQESVFNGFLENGLINVSYFEGLKKENLIINPNNLEIYQENDEINYPLVWAIKDL